MVSIAQSIALFDFHLIRIAVRARKLSTRLDSLRHARAAWKPGERRRNTSSYLQLLKVLAPASESLTSTRLSCCLVSPRMQQRRLWFLS